MTLKFNNISNNNSKIKKNITIFFFPKERVKRGRVSFFGHKHAYLKQNNTGSVWALELFRLVYFFTVFIFIYLIIL